MLKKIDMQQLEANLREAEKTLSGIEDASSPVGQLITGDALHSKLLAKVKDLQQKMREATAATSEIGKVIYTDTLYRQLRDPLIELDLSLAKLQSGQGPLGQMLRDPAQYEKLRGDIQNLRSQVASMASGPFLQSDVAYNSWIRTVDSMIRLVDEMNTSPMLGSQATYESLAGAAKEFADTVKDFRQNPKKYLRLKLF
jgi:phospholipid/cholesterol/gamma-HCH transport system substrate-binding protein